MADLTPNPQQRLTELIRPDVTTFMNAAASGWPALNQFFWNNVSGWGRPDANNLNVGKFLSGSSRFFERQGQSASVQNLVAFQRLVNTSALWLHTAQRDSGGAIKGFPSAQALNDLSTELGSAIGERRMELSVADQADWLQMWPQAGNIDLVHRVMSQNTAGLGLELSVGHDGPSVVRMAEQAARLGRDARNEIGAGINWKACGVANYVGLEMFGDVTAPASAARSWAKGFDLGHAATRSQAAATIVKILANPENNLNNQSASSMLAQRAAAIAAEFPRAVVPALESERLSVDQQRLLAVAGLMGVAVRFAGEDGPAESVRQLAHFVSANDLDADGISTDNAASVIRRNANSARFAADSERFHLTDGSAAIACLNTLYADGQMPEATAQLDNVANDLARCPQLSAQVGSFIVTQQSLRSNLAGVVQGLGAMASVGRETRTLPSLSPEATAAVRTAVANAFEHAVRAGDRQAFENIAQVAQSPIARDIAVTSTGVLAQLALDNQAGALGLMSTVTRPQRGAVLAGVMAVAGQGGCPPQLAQNIVALAAEPALQGVALLSQN